MGKNDSDDLPDGIRGQAKLTFSCKKCKGILMEITILEGDEETIVYGHEIDDGCECKKQPNR